MVQLSALFIALAVSGSALAAPSWHTKRIAQVISDSTTKWEAACDAAGGGEQCNPIAVNAFGTLLAAPGPCEQQDNADKMVDLAKQLNNDPDVIKFAQIFAQQPRNTPSSQSVPYCQTAPKNTELNGLFQCQFQGADPTTFVGGTKVGGAGTIPFGQKAPLNPAGSCPAHPDGPIADGTQLVDQVSSSGADSKSSSSGSSSNSSNSSATVAATVTVTVAPEATSAADSGNATDCPGMSSAGAPAATSAPADASDDGDDASSATAAASAATASSTSAATGASGFQLQNGKDAQALNKQFASLSANATCEEGDQACVGTAFAQCVGGRFVETPCAATLMCAALPLVNTAGTSIACTTQADAAARIAATGAQGGVTGN